MINNCKLKEVAKIEISGVDKKIKKDEIKVKSCNFVDVYYNWTISNYTSTNFLDITATQNEIDKFTLYKGQVAITKDSETRDDIGMSAYISKNFRKVLLGYHCALITPDENKINGKFLNVIFHTKFAQKYFKYNSSGSGQRYMLTDDTISNFPLTLPSLKHQKKIGEFFYKIDKIIENNNRINEELEKISKIIYNYWFLQFEFPNKDGLPYKSSGGKMVWNNKLNQYIPDGWFVENLFSNSLCKIIKPGIKKFKIKNYLATSNVSGSVINDGEWIDYENRESRANMQPCINSVWFAKMKNSIKHLTLSNHSQWFVNKYILSTGFLGLKCHSNCLSYISCIIENDRFENHKNLLSHGATQEAINNEDLKSIEILVPSNDVLYKFEKTIYKFIQMKNEIFKENDMLISLRDFLLPLLVNGQIRFKD